MTTPNKITAVVLCGGLGTRLREFSGGLPKPMVDVAGRPFLEYLLDYLADQNVKDVVLAVSYQYERITEHFGNYYQDMAIRYSIEQKPLGTGGAIKQAIDACIPDRESAVLVINGDTFVDFSLSEMYQTLTASNADLSMTLVDCEDTSRYGRVTTDENRVIRFEEKQQGSPGLINAGVYLLSPRLIDDLPKDDVFSFENDVLMKIVSTHRLYGCVTKGYFIDIGIPEDFKKAQIDFGEPNKHGRNTGI
ncbi:nucleotidyltransferase family protein [Enterovibrio paralichthyis]|uniref:nucleotidyltransferase family protein n=1 Tax=Enterovibrio paralichthyis TaxID=2853805 RepID=UPI001C48C0B7|nr:nucleotidyltransferase family protein [Enterovibrio paralichthyis]MBV7299756.1 nucleotidyltransferase family protein [Enterovibrio paralichthyis]